MKRMLTFTMLLFAAASFFSCTEKVEMEEELGLNADFYITTTRDVIQANGTDKTQIQVFLQDVDVTEEVKFYDENDEPISKEIIGKDGVYSTNTPGVLKFYAQHGTYSTFNREFEDNGLYKITAIEQAVPGPVAEEDADKNRLDFVHRAFLTQYTGNSCGYCPYMIHIIRQLAEENYIPEKAVLAAVHSYKNVDKAYITRPRVSGYPYLHVDLKSGVSHSSGKGYISGLIDESVSTPVKAGISVNPVLYKDENKLVVTVSVKAAEDGIFNVGAWLLQDDIFSEQADYDGVQDKYGYPNGEFNMHDNCVRLVDSDYMGTYFGRLIGPMKKSDVRTKTFVIDLNKKWTNTGTSPLPTWDQVLNEKLHLAVFVSYGYKKTNGKVYYSVCNAIDCPITAPTPFEYVAD